MSDSGIILTDAPEPKRETWLREDLKFFRRMYRWFTEKGLDVPDIECKECHKPLFMYDKPCEIELECGCKVRVMEK